MSTTSTKVTIPLKAIEMDQLKDYIMGKLVESDLNPVLENINDTELQLIVNKRGFQTKLSLQRLSHRPLDMDIEIDYNEAAKTKDVFRAPKQSSEQKSSDFLNNRIFWIIIIVGGLLIGAVEIATNLIARLSELTNEQLTSIERVQLIVTILVLSVMVILIWVYGLPRLLRQREQNLKKFDIEVLNIVINQLQQLNRELTETDVIRCWSCFEKIELEDNVCPYCGKQQKEI